MAHKTAQLITALFLGATLSGCSTISQFGQSIWGHTSHITHKAGQSVAQLFRSAPAVETGADYLHGESGETLNARLMTADSAQSTPKLRGRYQGYKSYEADPEVQSRKTAQAEQTGALSYVKIGGGSLMSEWQSCEAQSGGYFRMGQTGYTVKPAFDRCMRGLGYISEAEAEAKFADLNTSVQLAP